MTVSTSVRKTYKTGLWKKFLLEELVFSNTDSSPMESVIAAVQYYERLYGELDANLRFDFAVPHINSLEEICHDDRYPLGSLYKVLVQERRKSFLNFARSTQRIMLFDSNANEEDEKQLYNDFVSILKFLRLCKTNNLMYDYRIRVIYLQLVINLRSYFQEFLMPYQLGSPAPEVIEYVTRILVTLGIKNHALNDTYFDLVAPDDCLYHTVNISSAEPTEVQPMALTLRVNNFTSSGVSARGYYKDLKILHTKYYLPYAITDIHSNSSLCLSALKSFYGFQKFGVWSPLMVSNKRLFGRNHVDKCFAGIITRFSNTTTFMLPESPRYETVLATYKIIVKSIIHPQYDGLMSIRTCFGRRNNDCLFGINRSDEKSQATMVGAVKKALLVSRADFSLIDLPAERGMSTFKTIRDEYDVAVYHHDRYVGFFRPTHVTNDLQHKTVSLLRSIKWRLDLIDEDLSFLRQTFKYKVWRINKTFAVPSEESALAKSRDRITRWTEADKRLKTGFI